MICNKYGGIPLKKATTFVLFFLLLLSLSGCGESSVPNADVPDVIVSEVCYRMVTFDEAIENSECAVIGEYTEIEEYREYVFYHFNVTNVLYGTVNADEVSVYDIRTSTKMDDRYEVGKPYILILNEEEVVLFDKQVRHIEPASMMLPMDGPYSIQGREIEYPEDMDFIDHIVSLRSQYAAAEAQGKQELKPAYST